MLLHLHPIGVNILFFFFPCNKWVLNILYLSYRSISPHITNTTYFQMTSLLEPSSILFSSCVPESPVATQIWSALCWLVNHWCSLGSGPRPSPVQTVSVRGLLLWCREGVHILEIGQHSLLPGHMLQHVLLQLPSPWWQCRHCFTVRCWWAPPPCGTQGYVRRPSQVLTPHQLGWRYARCGSWIRLSISFP